MNRHQYAPLILLLSITVACSRSEQEQLVHTFQIIEKNGITIAETTGGPKYAGELFQYERSFRLNQDENVEASLLVQPTVILVDDEGAIYVADDRPTRIVRFDASGNYSCDIGREGEGPGEYRHPIPDFFQDGLLVVRDDILNRISWFDTDGTFIKSSPLLPLPGMTVQQLRLGPRDERLLLGDYQRGFPNAYHYQTAISVVLSADGDSMTSVIADSVNVGYYFIIEEYFTGGSAGMYFRAWPRVLYHPAHGLVVSIGLEPVFQCYNLSGQLSRLIRLDAEPESVTSVEKQLVRAYLRNRIIEARNDRERAVRQKALEYVEFQDPKAYLYVGFIDILGYIWAASSNINWAIEQAVRPLPTLHLFSPEGEYLGVTELPDHNFQVSNGHVLSAQEDEETGAMEVLVYTIHPLITGFWYP